MDQKQVTCPLPGYYAAFPTTSELIAEALPLISVEAAK